MYDDTHFGFAKKVLAVRNAFVRSWSNTLIKGPESLLLSSACLSCRRVYVYLRSQPSGATPCEYDECEKVDHCFYDAEDDPPGLLALDGGGYPEIPPISI